MVQRAVALGEIALRLDGLTLALFLGADVQIDGYRHGAIRGDTVVRYILRTTMTRKKTRPRMVRKWRMCCIYGA